MAPRPTPKPKKAPPPKPEMEFAVFAKGLTIDSHRLTATRLVHWDQQGPCQTCHSREIQFDLEEVNAKGMKIKSPRLHKPFFIGFDQDAEKQIANGAVVLVRTRYKTVPIPLVMEDPAVVPIPNFTGTIIAKPLPGNYVFGRSLSPPPPKTRKCSPILKSPSPKITPIREETAKEQEEVKKSEEKNAEAIMATGEPQAMQVIIT